MTPLQRVRMLRSVVSAYVRVLLDVCDVSLQ